MKILFFSHTATLGGAGLCLYRLVRSVRSYALPVVVLAEQGPLADMLRAAGITVTVDPRIRRLMSNTNSTSVWHTVNPLTWLDTIRSIRRAAAHCRREQPDVVHINTAVLLHLAVGARWAGVRRVILHVREHWNVRTWDPRAWLKEHMVAKRVDRIVAISRTAATRFGFREKTSVIYDPPDFTDRDGPLNPSESFGLAKGAKILLVLGGRCPIKGSLIAMQAMQRVTAENVVMLVVGGRADADPRKQLIRWCLRTLAVETYGLKMDRLERESNQRIVMTPSLAEIKSLMQQSVMVLCPFTTPHFAMPALEAGFLGKPVVLSDNGYAREVVRNGQTGVLVPSGDVAALARAIEALLASPDTGRRLGEAARRFVTRRFHQDLEGTRLAEVLRGVP